MRCSPSGASRRRRKSSATIAVEVHGVERPVARAVDHTVEHAPAGGDQAAADEHLVDGDVVERVEHDDVGLSPGDDRAEVDALQPVRGVVGRAAEREHRVHAVRDEAAQQMVEAAVLEQGEREQVVGRGDEVRRRDRERVHLLDDAREDGVERAAQLDGHARRAASRGSRAR